MFVYPAFDKQQMRQVISVCQQMRQVISVCLSRLIMEHEGCM